MEGWKSEINGDGKTNYFFPWRKCDASRSAWKDRKSDGRTDSNSWLNDTLARPQNPDSTTARVDRFNRGFVMQFRFNFNVIPRLRVTLYEMEYLFICSILTFPTELFEFEYSMEGSLVRFFYFMHFRGKKIREESFHHIFLEITFWYFINCLISPVFFSN